MRKSSLRRGCVAVAVLSSLALAATACGGTTKNDAADDSGAAAAATGKADPNAELKKGLTVGFLPKQVNNPYFTSSDKGGEAALKELGSSYKEVGPSSGTDTAGQVSYVNTLTQQQVNAMAVSAQDPGALCT
ncbi:substrate-binding domain-containing protein, partial [Streptomyces sp. NPDC090106]|uniref:substrate-binding domain-containing protein n=1 Tax=Streptomyces sp. NPDC090106 TaxID=3365946 RepID=UPI003804C207